MSRLEIYSDPQEYDELELPYFEPIGPPRTPAFPNEMRLDAEEMSKDKIYAVTRTVASPQRQYLTDVARAACDEFQGYASIVKSPGISLLSTRRSRLIHNRVYRSHPDAYNAVVKKAVLSVNASMSAVPVVVTGVQVFDKHRKATEEKLIGLTVASSPSSVLVNLQADFINTIAPKGVRSSAGQLLAGSENLHVSLARTRDPVIAEHIARQLRSAPLVGMSLLFNDIKARKTSTS